MQMRFPLPNLSQRTCEIAVPLDRVQRKIEMSVKDQRR
jgi:hypothetical protein